MNDDSTPYARDRLDKNLEVDQFEEEEEEVNDEELSDQSFNDENDSVG